MGRRSPAAAQACAPPSLPGRYGHPPFSGRWAAPLLHPHGPSPCPPTGSLLDGEARARTRTIYLPFGAVPMFPRVLADGPFSLRAASDAPASGGPASGVCCALSICATLGPDGALDGYEVTPSAVRVTHRLTYDEADADIALGPGGAAHPELQRLYEAARLR
jgi:exoribonuclease-2